MNETDMVIFVYVLYVKLYLNLSRYLEYHM